MILGMIFRCYMIVSHCATGRGRVVRLWGVALCDGYGARCATLVARMKRSPNGMRDVPLRGRRCPLTRGLGFPHGDFVSPHRDLGCPCTRRRSSLRRWAPFPVRRFGFPCTRVSIPLYGQTGWLEGAGRGRHRKTGLHHKTGRRRPPYRDFLFSTCSCLTRLGVNGIMNPSVENVSMRMARCEQRKTY